MANNTSVNQPFVNFTFNIFGNKSNNRPQSRSLTQGGSYTPNQGGICGKWGYFRGRGHNNNSKPTYKVCAANMATQLQFVIISSIKIIWE